MLSANDSKSVYIQFILRCQFLVLAELPDGYIVIKLPFSEALQQHLNVRLLHISICAASFH